MARPIKDGLDYFPKDTDFYRDRKIRALIGRFGADGVVLYDYILCEVYRDGYATEIDDSFRDIAAADLKMSPEKIGLILDYLLNQSMLLDSQLFKTVKVLTSRGIQTRYQEAVRQRALKRGICVDGKLWLLDEAETESFIQVRHDDSLSWKNPSKPGKNPGFSVEESIKESKGKESKVNESKDPPLTPQRGDGNTILPKYKPEWFERFWALYPRHTAKKQAARAWDKLKPSRGLCDVMAAAIKAQMSTAQWANPEHIPHPSTWLNGARWHDEVKEEQHEHIGSFGRDATGSGGEGKSWNLRTTKL